MCHRFIIIAQTWHARYTPISRDKYGRRRLKKVCRTTHTNAMILCGNVIKYLLAWKQTINSGHETHLQNITRKTFFSSGTLKR